MNNIVYGILITLALVHIFIATTATVVVLRDKSLEKLQVIFKLLVSWIIVYVGPLFVLYIMNDQSPELVPKFAQKGLLHAVFFAPLKPPPHGDNPMASEGSYFQNSDISDFGGGADGD